jgi:hypothetical protein
MPAISPREMNSRPAIADYGWFRRLAFIFALLLACQAFWILAAELSGRYRWLSALIWKRQQTGPQTIFVISDFASYFRKRLSGPCRSRSSHHRQS